MQDKYTKITNLDAQGRVLIPVRIREALGLSADTAMEVSLEGQTIKVNTAVDRCCLCGRTGKNATLHWITVGKDQKLICNHCIKSVKEARK